MATQRDDELSAPTGTAPDRWITLEGALNFRDFGGYQTSDGRHVRWRTLFRADGLSRLTEADCAVLRSLGMATVLDLRSTTELEIGRFPVEAVPVSFHHLPIVEETMDPRKYRLAEGKLGERYEELARFGAPQIATALSIMADPASHPLVLHCTAGKDRTGVLAAVTLSLLGVADETIIEDYTLSSAAIEALRERWRAANPERGRELDEHPEVYSVAPTNISWLFGRLRAEHGSIEGYAEAAGVSPDLVDRLRATLLE
ncbi:MAG TPA: tyrosine-protein phosphatase [Acidimicrobiales bacterium]|nr:tyrosine-protein phosphatase [Acidimicrobiales bacterium]